MEWNWLAWFFTFGFVVFSASVAWLEGSLTRRGCADVNMPFLNHGGMWGDAFLLSAVNALLLPHLTPVLRTWPAVLALFCTWFAHLSWAGINRRTGRRDFLWPRGVRGRALDEMGWVGWLHCIYTFAQLALLFAYAATPLPPEVVWVVSLLLTVHVLAGMAQPGWYLEGRINWLTAVSTAGAMAAVWIVAGWKIGLDRLGTP